MNNKFIEIEKVVYNKKRLAALEKYKSLYPNLNYFQKRNYENIFSELLGNSIGLAQEINTTTDIYSFIVFRDMTLDILDILSEHEQNMPLKKATPSSDYIRLTENMAAYEMEFLKRTYKRDNINSPLIIPSEELDAIKENFTLDAIAYTERDTTMYDFSTHYTISKSKINDSDMTGYEFEDYCAELLQKNGYYDVEVTQSSGDQGIDVIAYKDDIKYGIQCKYYNQPVGNKAVQEAYSGKKFYDCDIAVVMTNNTFTEAAYELAQKNRVKLWDKKYIAELESTI